MSIYVDIKKNLGNFHLQVQFEAENEILGILGKSGCGKSMTLRCIAGIVQPDEGQIILNGTTLFDSHRKINISPQKRNVGLMFQNYALFPHMTVFDNISISINADFKEKKRFIQTYLDLLRLDGLMDRYPRQLSGGQQQRVALARMMAKRPGIYMLDEPFSALDTHLRFSIGKEFSAALEAINSTVLYVSHSIEEVYKYCDRTAVMSNGQIVEIGETEQIFCQPTTLDGAKLTGYRNISPIEILDKDHFLATAWDMHIFHENIAQQRDMHYIAMRETDIQISPTPLSHNSFRMFVKDLQYSPTSTTLFLSRPSETAGKFLLYSIDGGYTKKDWLLFINDDLYVTLDSQKYLLLK
ncbi:MAG: sulfate/molybdate ABC transporter ATP-binding protein [Bacillota bacterium]|jgi:molybdate transport system ATP-binding protein